MNVMCLRTAGITANAKDFADSRFDVIDPRTMTAY